MKNSGQTENWRLKDFHIGSDSPNTQFGKYEHFQCIKSAEQLLTFVLLVFHQLSALKWLRWPMAKGAEEGLWPEARGDKKADGLGVLQSPSLHFLLLSPATGLSGAGLCKEMEHTAAGKGEQQHSSGSLN